MTEKRDQTALDGATAWCGVAIATLAVVTAHQVGVLAHLPDPPGKLLDSDGITESKTAHPLGIPDGALGLASYGITLALLRGAPNSKLARQILPWKLGADGAVAGFNAVRQVVTFRRVCSWCTGTALATVGMVYFGAKALRRMDLT